MSASLTIDFGTPLPAQRCSSNRSRASIAVVPTQQPLEPKLDLDSIVAGTLEFFSTRTRQDARTGSPYLAQDRDDQPGLSLQEFTAETRISGAHRGSVLVSASRAMLTIMLMRMGSTDITTSTMSAALRELATAIAVSIRASLGDEVMTWSPVVTIGGARRVRNPGRAPLVAPIHWRNYTANIALWID